MFLVSYIPRYVPTSRWRFTGQPQPKRTKIHAQCPPGCQGNGEHLSIDLIFGHRGLHKNWMCWKAARTCYCHAVRHILCSIKEMKTTSASHDIWKHWLLEGSYPVPRSGTGSFLELGGASTTAVSRVDCSIFDLLCFLHPISLFFNNLSLSLLTEY